MCLCGAARTSGCAGPVATLVSSALAGGPPALAGSPHRESPSAWGPLLVLVGGGRGPLCSGVSKPPETQSLSGKNELLSAPPGSFTLSHRLLIWSLVCVLVRPPRVCGPPSSGPGRSPGRGGETPALWELPASRDRPQHPPQGRGSREGSRAGTPAARAEGVVFLPSQ